MAGKGQGRGRAKGAGASFLAFQELDIPSHGVCGPRGSGCGRFVLSSCSRFLSHGYSRIDEVFGGC